MAKHSREEQARIDELNAQLTKLNKKDRDFAIHRIDQAMRFGWREISFWCDKTETPNPLDLVGVNPKGEFDFLPPVGETE